jgi:hypothetical protein
MLIDYYLRIPKRIRLLIVFLAIVLVAYFIVRFLSIETKNIPEDFLRARQEASLIAQEIVNLSNESVNKIDEIAKFDEEQKYTEALVMISQELERNRKAREKAVDLSVQLEAMAKNLAQISPASASQKALEAVSSETALISRLITYNDYLTQLLEVLRGKFLGKNSNDKIPELIQKLNNEAQAINDLNQKFNETMKEFDAK